MKIFSILLISFCLFLISGLNSYAATSTPSPVEQQIDELKDKIASRVAQLKLVEKRGILGKVNDVTDTQITMADIKGNIRFVDVDELTKFISSGSSNASFGISDIKKGDALGIVGLYNKQSRRILARAIYQTSISKMIHGYIAQVDPDNFILTVSTDDNNQFDVSVETTTRSFSYDKTSEKLIRSGFSRLKEEQKIFVSGTPDKKDGKKISADTIITLPDIVKKTKLDVSPSAVPSTGSGKKLTPIIKY